MAPPPLRLVVYDSGSVSAYYLVNACRGRFAGYPKKGTDPDLLPKAFQIAGFDYVNPPLLVPSMSLIQKALSNDTVDMAVISQKMSSTSEANGSKHAKENEDVTCTSSLVAIAAVDGTGSSASKCLKPDSSNEVHISCSDTSTVPPSEHFDMGGLSIDDGVLKRTSFTDLPLELMFKIFGYLYEDDLAQCTLVSRKFRTVANHRALWEPLYQEVFEYSRPLLHVGHAQFEFREPHDWPQPQSDESIVVNPWKESFKQLKDGIHVRPGYAPLYSGFGAGGRRLTQCDRLDQALRLVKARDENTEKLIFLHTGLYIPRTTVTINSDIQIIGASIGPDIASQVIIERRLTTTVNLAKGSQGTYLGWMTVRFAPDSGAVAAAIAAGNRYAHINHYALQICDDSTALVEHCVIHSSVTDGVAVCVKGSAANPTMRHCVVCDCESAGIYVMDEAQGQFEDCEIARNNRAGVGVRNRANPSFRRCHIHDGRSNGILTSNHGIGYFENCNIHNNQLSGIEVMSAANPTVTRCEVHHGQTNGVYVHLEGRGQFTENRIHSNKWAGIAITSHSDPMIRKNEIYNGLQDGISIFGEGRGLIEENDIFNNLHSGVEIRTGSSPKITRNKIWGGQGGGIFVHNNGQGVLEYNEIFDNAMAGVWIETDSNPTLRRNKIYDGRYVGVRISNKGRGVLEDNEVYGNTLSGIFVTTGSSPTIRKNRIHSGKQVGVHFYDNGYGLLEENDIFNNLHSGVVIETKSNPKITRNKIRDNQKGGVLIHHNGQGVLEENEIFDNAMAGVWIQTDGNPMLRRNKIHDEREEGVYIHKKGRGILEDNDIYRNALAGVAVLSKSNPMLRRNRVYEGRAAGIEIGRGAMATLESNAIFHNRFGGLCLTPGVRPTLCDNKIYDNDDLVEKTIAKGDCLFEITSDTSPAMHEIYRCDTCSMTEEDTICLNCIRTCHAGHDVHLVRHNGFFCDCGAGTLKHQCKLLGKHGTDPNVSLPSGIDTAPRLPTNLHTSTLFSSNGKSIRPGPGEVLHIDRSGQLTKARAKDLCQENSSSRLLMHISLVNGQQDGWLTEDTLEKGIELAVRGRPVHYLSPSVIQRPNDTDFKKDMRQAVTTESVRVGGNSNYYILPVLERSTNHFMLAVLVRGGDEILLLNSKSELGLSDGTRYAVQCWVKSIDGRRREISTPDVPQQRDDFNCGMFVIYFAWKLASADPASLARGLPSFSGASTIDWTKERIKLYEAIVHDIHAVESGQTTLHGMNFDFDDKENRKGMLVSTSSAQTHASTSQSPSRTATDKPPAGEMAEQLTESAKEIGIGPHAETNDNTDSNVKSEAGTPSSAVIAAVDGAGSSTSKRSKPDSSSEVRISSSGASTVPSSEYLDIGGLSIDDGVLDRVNFTELLPPEPTLKILWKSLYQEVFEYSLPLLHVGHGRFEFREPHDWPQPRSDESIVVDPWEESFKQLKDGIHVRPGYASLYSGFGASGRRLTQCDRLDQALRLVKARDENTEKLIFLHTGLYIPRTTVTINSDIQIIGASIGSDIASQVIIERRLTTTVVLAEGSQGAYLGWMTVRLVSDPDAVAAAIAARNPYARHYALQICDDSTALVEHCVIHSSATDGAAVCVKGSAANPTIQHCVVCDCESAGIYVMDEAQGQFEDCEIARNNGPGVGVRNRANPSFRRCDIHDGRNVGIFTSNHGTGYFENCNIHNNQLSGIEVMSAANPTVTRCEVHHGQTGGVYVEEKGRGQFMENRIHSNAFAGITIESHADPEITYNKIRGNQKGGVLIHDNGQGLLEDNEIFDNAMPGVWIETDGNPTLRRNEIYNGRDVGVLIFKGCGVLEDNDIYCNALAGVVIFAESNPTLRRNRVYEGRAAGIEIMSGAMATLESNVIFRNRFGGLFLETGAKPTLHDNEVYDNDDLMEKTIAKGGCLFEITSRTSPATHDVYRCDTCNTTEKDAICLSCIRTCHAGHTVHLVRCDRFICSCGAGALKNQCKLQSEVRDNDSTLPPVDFELD